MSKFFVVVVLMLISCSFLASAKFVRPAPVKPRDCTEICANPNQSPVCADFLPRGAQCFRHPCEMLRTVESECEACKRNLRYTKGACKPKSF